MLAAYKFFRHTSLFLEILLILVLRQKTITVFFLFVNVNVSSKQRSVGEDIQLQRKCVKGTGVRLTKTVKTRPNNKQHILDR